MEIIWIAWFFGGLIMGLICCHLAYKGVEENDDRMLKGQSDIDSDIRLYVPSRDRDRSGNNGSNKRMEAEEVINGLQTIRMAASRQEKEYIDYACECVAIREKIFDKLIEYMKGEKNEKHNNSDA